MVGHLHCVLLAATAQQLTAGADPCYQRTALTVQVPYVHRPMESAVEEMAGSIKDKGTAARLAAAAARRKERLAQQQHQQHQKQGQQLGQQPQGPGEG
jgi:hypothetical protein